MFIYTHEYLFYIALVVSIVSLYSLACYPELARSVPLNFILLAVFTITEGYVLATFTTMFKPMSVLSAAVITTAIVIGLTAYAFYTSTDFTYGGGMLFMLGMGLIAASLLGIFFESKTYDLIISLGFALLFGIYLIYDTQLIIGGEGRAASYSIDDYVLAAVNLYLDIINMFIEILKIIGDRRD